MLDWPELRYYKSDVDSGQRPKGVVQVGDIMLSEGLAVEATNWRENCFAINPKSEEHEPYFLQAVPSLHPHVPAPARTSCACVGG